MHYELTKRDSASILYYFREKEIEKELKDAPFSSVRLQIDDWEKDLSPFPYANFAGNGPKTLIWLKETVQKAEEGMDIRKRCIAGYSLAGLFALYALYETDLFDGAASCSGSLWFPGFSGYLTQKAPLEKKRIYLSLGNKEEKTRHPLMSQVGEITRAYAAKLETEHTDMILEMNEGGHFHEPDRRLLRGIEWLMKE